MSFKQITGFIAIALIVFPLSSFSPAQDRKKIPSVILKDLDGNPVDTGEFDNNGNPTIITFWATWCKCCEGELTTLNDLYDDWKAETGVRIIAISLDDEKTRRMVEPTVNASGWEFDFLLDPNGEFKRLMGVNTPPHLFILNENNEIAYSHSGYIPGDEEIVYDHLLSISEE